MAEIAKLRRWKRPTHKEVTLADTKAAMLDAMTLVDNPKTSPDMLQHIANEWMFAETKSAWPLWQALAHNKRTPVLVLRQLHEKRLWYLDILIIQHPDVPKDILEATVLLNKEILAAHGSYKGYDRNKELRAIARKRLNLSLEEEEDEK